jgi:hypothetical protein
MKVSIFTPGLVVPREQQREVGERDPIALARELSSTDARYFKYEDDPGLYVIGAALIGATAGKRLEMLARDIASEKRPESQKKRIASEIANVRDRLASGHLWGIVMNPDSESFIALRPLDRAVTPNGEVVTIESRIRSRSTAREDRGPNSHA